MWVHILGSAAGGGFPQWNCNCTHCRGVREGTLAAHPRTQSSIAISADYRHWFLFNASPDIRNQLLAFPPLYPQESPRHTPIQGIILSDAEMDSTLGLLSLRETSALHIYATAWVYAALNEWNPLLRTLQSYCEVQWQAVRLHEPITLRTLDGNESGLCIEAFSTNSTKSIIYAAQQAAHPESTVGYRITDTRTQRTLVYMPAVQALDDEVQRQLHDCSCLLIDGTCWQDDELVQLGVQKTARAMGHLPISGEDGSLAQLTTLAIERIVYIHINNTNPLLIENSAQRQAVEVQGIAVAFDGMEMEI